MSPVEVASLLVSLGVLAVALGLLAWLRADVRARGDVVSEEDQAHFTHQDRRRRVVAGVMIALALGIYLGARVPHQVQGRPNLLFVQIWIAICLLVLFLVALAIVDGLATRRYAVRHRKHLLREGLKLLRDDMKLRARVQRATPPESETDATPHE